MVDHFTSVNEVLGSILNERRKKTLFQNVYSCYQKNKWEMNNWVKSFLMVGLPSLT